MKTRVLIFVGVLGAIVLVVGVFSFFAWNNNDSGMFPSHNEGLMLIYLSDHFMQERLKEHNTQEIQIKKITDRDLEKVPKIKELIAKAMQEEFPLNETGRISSDIDTLKKYHKYYATILAEKYSKDPGEFIRILPARQGDLEISPDAYNYEFDGSHFEYNGIQYGWEHSRFVDYGIENMADIGAYKISHPLDPNRHIWATITDKQMTEHMPLLKKAINKIGTIQENIEMQNIMSGLEVDRYTEWYEQNVPDGIFEYDDKYFQLARWIA